MSHRSSHTAYKGPVDHRMCENMKIILGWKSVFICLNALSKASAISEVVIYSRNVIMVSCFKLFPAFAAVVFNIEGKDA